jgi:hypothetical protein
VQERAGPGRLIPSDERGTSRRQGARANQVDDAAVRPGLDCWVGVGEQPEQQRPNEELGTVAAVHHGRQQPEVGAIPDDRVDGDDR